MKYEEWRDMVETVRARWRTMWRERIEDKERAEGVANQDFPTLFVERGTVIVASRDYRPPDFEEIVEQHRLEALPSGERPLSLAGGGYGKLIRDVIVKQPRYGLTNRRRKLMRREPEQAKKGHPLKKGGRGWLHATG